MSGTVVIKISTKGPVFGPLRPTLKKGDLMQGFGLDPETDALQIIWCEGVQADTAVVEFLYDFDSWQGDQLDHLKKTRIESKISNFLRSAKSVAEVTFVWMQANVKTVACTAYD